MKQLAKPTNAYSCRAARYDGKQNTQYQSGAGQSSRGNRGNFGFRGAAGGGNGDWRSDNTQQSVGRGTYNPPDSAKRFYCHKKGHLMNNCPTMKENCWKQDPCLFCQEPGHNMTVYYKLKSLLKYKQTENKAISMMRGKSPPSDVEM